MKLTTLLPLAVTATGLVLPDAQVFEQMVEKDGQTDRHHHAAAASWWENLPSKDEVISKTEKAASDIWSDVDTTVNKAKDKITSEFESLLALGEATIDDLAEGPRHPPHEPSNQTIWELVSSNKYTTRFAEIAGTFQDIVDYLNSTTANKTLFVPTDKAFEHLPPHKPDDDDDEKKKRIRQFIHASLQYHAVDDVYTARRLLTTHTVPTALKEPMLGGEPQRLRVQLGLRGLGLNFFTRVVAPNIGASNGIIHAIDHILVPPPFVGRELSLVPSVFSTLLLAYEKTKFVNFIHNVRTNGSTVFAPTNQAFAKLGFGANAFLFNSPKGLKYLEALLKYQIVANETLYSDAVYKNNGGKEEDVEHPKGKFTVDLPTLLHDVPVRVEVSRWAGFISMVVNGRGKVVIQDGVAKNGVIQVVNQVPLPPCRHHKGETRDVGAKADDEISVEDLISRLEPYLEAETKQIKEVKKTTKKPAFIDEL